MRFVLLCVISLMVLAVIPQPSIAVELGWGTITLMPGENWVSAPVIPLDPLPTSVFSGIDIANNLTWFDPISQRPIAYDPAHPGDFPNILMGDGYTITNHGSTPVILTYEGVIINDTDVWISLPGGGNGGMHWIGVPYTIPTAFDRIIVTDGEEAYYAADAALLGWIDPIWRTMNPATQTIETVGATTQQGVDTHYLRPGYMYKVQTYRDDLAIILDAPVPEPTGLSVLISGLFCITALTRRRKQ
ncbi:MAG: PEP-CTERM sorting domain-containing protein [Armatimonadota bacterium]|nr:PEP-CTERM sorting domain-containing protein [Armatimonadota bacterium]